MISVTSVVMGMNFHPSSRRRPMIAPCSACHNNTTKVTSINKNIVFVMLWSCMKTPVLETAYKGLEKEECAPLLSKIRRARGGSHEIMALMIVAELRAQSVNSFCQMYETEPPESIQSIVYEHDGRRVQVVVACDHDQTIYEFARDGKCWWYVDT